jgi:hypothetical protein
MHWYYLDAQRQQNQTDEDSLRQLLRDGSIENGTLVWNETLTEWLPISKALPSFGPESDGPIKPRDASSPIPSPSLPGGAAPFPLTGSAAGVRAFASILSANSGWTRFLGGSLLLLGILLCLTVAGALIGWLPIWQGRLLLRIARLAGEVQGSGSAIGFTEAMESVSTFLKLSAITFLLLTLLSLFGGAAAFALPLR